MLCRCSCGVGGRCWRGSQGRGSGQSGAAVVQGGEAESPWARAAGMDGEEVHLLPRLPGPALGVTEASSPVGGPGGKLTLEGAADDAAAEERPAEEHLWPGRGHGPPGAGGQRRAGPRPAAQRPPAEEEQAAGERLGCPATVLGTALQGGRQGARTPPSAPPPASGYLP